MIWEAHYIWVAGHFGVEKIVALLNKYFYWPNIRQDVEKYIRSCTACAIAKPTIKNQVLCTPLPTPSRTNSNGHGGGKEEDINLVETIIKLQKDVSSDKVDNERLMKAKEQ